MNRAQIKQLNRRVDELLSRKKILTLKELNRPIELGIEYVNFKIEKENKI